MAMFTMEIGRMTKWKGMEYTYSPLPKRNTKVIGQME
jgi:hypothetical protein